MIKIVFVSNFLNHHQLPFCKALMKHNNVEFTFIAIEPVPGERLNLGYQDMNEQYSFVLRAYESSQIKELAHKVVDECDLAIVGAIPNEFTEKRIHEGKLTFYYMERLYKYGYFHYNKKHIIPLLWPNFISVGKSGLLYDAFLQFKKSKNFYMLCAGNYTAGDMALLGCFINKTYKWGYFPAAIDYDINTLLESKHSNKINLLWVGRFIEWKHPEACINIAKKLLHLGYEFRLDIIGSGELENDLKLQISEYGLEKNVFILGSMPYEKVRQYMERANIFLFTSDYKEGWGAVLNEAMNSGCAVVANDAAGATKFLIKNGTNGYLYRNGNERDLLKKVVSLMNSEQKRYDFGYAAYKTIVSTWNADIAAERLLKLKECIESGTTIPYQEGPCSVARRFYKGIMVE